MTELAANIQDCLADLLRKPETIRQGHIEIAALASTITYIGSIRGCITIIQVSLL